jgi:hypothetical protein
LRRSIGRVHHIFLGICREDAGDFRHTLCQLSDGGIDRRLIIGDFAFHHFQHHGVQALGLPSHQVVLLDGYLLLRHDRADTEE